MIDGYFKKLRKGIEAMEKGYFVLHVILQSDLSIGMILTSKSMKYINFWQSKWYFWSMTPFISTTYCKYGNNLFLGYLLN